MRILVMFDLPTTTENDRREYRRFRKYLVKNGFLMLQESVYSKISKNNVMTQSYIDNIRKNKPPTGSVLVLSVTEKEFARKVYIVGGKKSDVIDTDERLVIL